MKRIDLTPSVGKQAIHANDTELDLIKCLRSFRLERKSPIREHKTKSVAGEQGRAAMERSNDYPTGATRKIDLTCRLA